MPNINQNESMPNSFPEERKFPEGADDPMPYKWRHSDIKDVAYIYVYPAYQQLLP